MQLKEEVIDIVCQVLDVDKSELDCQKSLYDCLGVDSTEMVEISVAINKKLGVKLGQREITNKHSLDEIVKLLEGKK